MKTMNPAGWLPTSASRPWSRRKAVASPPGNTTGNGTDGATRSSAGSSDSRAFAESSRASTSLMSCVSDSSSSRWSLIHCVALTRPREWHREAAGVTAGNRGHDGARPGSDLPDQRQVAEPFPGATGQAVPATWGEIAAEHRPQGSAGPAACEPICSCPTVAPQEPLGTASAGVPGPGGPGH